MGNKRNKKDKANKDAKMDGSKNNAKADQNKENNVKLPDIEISKVFRRLLEFRHIYEREQMTKNQGSNPPIPGSSSPKALPSSFIHQKSSLDPSSIIKGVGQTENKLGSLPNFSENNPIANLIQSHMSNKNIGK